MKGEKEVRGDESKRWQEEERGGEERVGEVRGERRRLEVARVAR